MKQADKLFSQIIRARGRCEAAGDTDFPCSGGLQCAHLISRRYHATRWNVDNAACLCAAHHMYWTHRPLEWDVWCLDLLGPSVWAELKLVARAGGKTDYAELIPALQAKADALAA